MIYNFDVYFMECRIFKKTMDQMGLDMSAYYKITKYNNWQYNRYNNIIIN